MSSNTVKTHIEAYCHSDSKAVARPGLLQIAVAQGAAIILSGRSCDYATHYISQHGVIMT